MASNSALKSISLCAVQSVHPCNFCLFPYVGETLRFPLAVDRFMETPFCDFLLYAGGEEIAELHPETGRPLLLPDLDVRE
eukprot:7986153-Heterocapsa_arctica.AAC.1